MEKTVRKSEWAYVRGEDRIWPHALRLVVNFDPEGYCSLFSLSWYQHSLNPSGRGAIQDALKLTNNRVLKVSKGLKSKRRNKKF